MDSLLTKEKKNIPTTTTTTSKKGCTNPCCFFCTMKEPNSSLRRAGVANFFKEMPLRDDQEEEHVLALSGLWNIAMTQPDDPLFPSLGIFTCMASLINKGVSNRDWLLRDQNIYIPYYAAHVIGSYTMNKVEFAEKAVESGVIPPLMELLRGKISWLEQRVAVRALGHLASYDRTFESVAAYEEEMVKLAMRLASTCLDVVYVDFVVLKDKKNKKRLKYQCDLLTRGVGGGLEMENQKAEEWASQLQCWSLYLLNCFACKERSLDLICNNQDFLINLCHMWGGGLMNQNSPPAGVGLIRILCYSKTGRKNIAEFKQVIENLCNLSRSSDDWQYMGIDCLLFLLKDPGTRYKVIETAALFLIDLVDLKSLPPNRPTTNLGEEITRALLFDYNNNKQSGLKFIKSNKKVRKALEETWELKVERRKGEKKMMMSEEKVEDIRVLVGLIKQEAKHMFWLGEIGEAAMKYSEALDVCGPSSLRMMMRNERMILYSNRAQCHLLLREPDAAISDSTRALCLSTPSNSHCKSLWRRSQAYDMKGLAKESLMDCIMFINCCIKSEKNNKTVNKIPYCAARMISKHMDSMWLFASARSKVLSGHQVNKVLQQESNGENKNGNEEQIYDDMMMIRMIMEKKNFISGLSTIIEEPVHLKGGSRRELERERR